MHSRRPGVQLCTRIGVVAGSEAARSELGACTSDVVQTRIYLTDAKRWPVVARAHREVFERARPAATAIAADPLDPRMLVEVEVEVEARAYVDG